jgi:UTP-glucose-1-phosphate uridylyltransferase
LRLPCLNDGDADGVAETRTTDVDGEVRIIGLVEKPSPAEAPSNLIVIGRYVLAPDIFEVIERTPPGRGARSRSPTPCTRSRSRSRS